jgi:hypothetical protein
MSLTVGRIGVGFRNLARKVHVKVRDHRLTQEASRLFSTMTTIFQNTISDFQDFGSLAYKGASSFYLEYAQKAYVGAQGFWPINKIFLDNGRFLDRTLNSVLGFENQKERLQSLSRQLTSTYAGKWINYLGSLEESLEAGKGITRKPSYVDTGM